MKSSNAPPEKLLLLNSHKLSLRVNPGKCFIFGESFRKVRFVTVNPSKDILFSIFHLLVVSFLHGFHEVYGGVDLFLGLVLTHLKDGKEGLEESIDSCIAELAEIV